MRGPGGQRSTRSRSGRAAVPHCGSSPPLLDARNVVEIGTGCGISGVWLMRGMRARRRADHRSTSRPSTSGWPRRPSTRPDSPSQRVRLIPGAALRGAAAAHRRALRPGLLRRRQARVPAVPRRRRSGCCASAAWSPSTTRCGTTRSPTRSVRDADTTAIREMLRRWPSTSSSSRCSSPSATACCSPRGLRKLGPCQDGGAWIQ